MNNGLLVNLILASISVVFFLQLLSNKRKAAFEAKKYEDQLKSESKKFKEIERNHQSELNDIRVSTQSDPSQKSEIKLMIDSLVSEVANLRKEKDTEFNLRLEAEKQIDLALQKTSDVQKRIDDWRIIQEANLQDATYAISKAGDNLYERLITNHKLESETIRNKVEDTMKNVYDYLEKIVKQVQFLNTNNVDIHQAVNQAINSNVSSFKVPPQQNNDLEEVLKSAHLQPRVDYFMHYNLPDELKKLVLCETMIAIDKSNAIIVDVKSAKFFIELFAGRAKGNIDAEVIFKQKIDRYLSYLNNPKYTSNVINYFSKQKILSPEAQSSLIMLVPSEKEVEEFEKLGSIYIEMLEDCGINLHSLESFSNLIFGE